ncbi:MAG TPA: chemotaxis protein CheW [Gemmatimonas sp.]|uniref:chemotaxis protein CheW n=1 Tax=Gemmatimonas sp. TaxID=1962908 RepID=UPI002EDB2F55
MRSGGDLLGIPIAQVREVVRPTGVRPVPGTPALQAGIVNVRGAIVTVLDLQALRTGVRAVTPGSIVLLSYGSRMLGLAVDAVHDVRVMTDEAEAKDASGSADLSAVMPLDAVALCARHMHSVEERER